MYIQSGGMCPVIPKLIHGICSMSEEWGSQRVRPAYFHRAKRGALSRAALAEMKVTRRALYSWDEIYSRRLLLQPRDTGWYSELFIRTGAHVMVPGWRIHSRSQLGFFPGAPCAPEGSLIQVGRRKHCFSDTVNERNMCQVFWLSFTDFTNFQGA